MLKYYRYLWATEQAVAIKLMFTRNRSDLLSNSCFIAFHVSNWFVGFSFIFDDTVRDKFSARAYYQNGEENTFGCKNNNNLGLNLINMMRDATGHNYARRILESEVCSFDHGVNRLILVIRNTWS